jgi:hypothetical protein
MPSLLPAPPGVPGPDGQPLFGAYQGELGKVDLSRLAPPHHFPRWAERLRRKRWHYALYTTPELIAVMAVAELGYVANAFFAALDLREKRPLIDVTLLGPPAPLTTVSGEMSSGLSARFRGPGARFVFGRAPGEDRYRHTVELSPIRHPRLGRVRFHGEALATGAPPPLALVAPVPGGGSTGGLLSRFLPPDGVNVTQKSVGLLAAGRLDVGGASYPLDGGVVGLDSTHGFLARHTRWHWAMGAGRLEDGTPLGLNLVAGFNESEEGPGENALFLGAELEPVGRAQFRFNADDPLDLWQLSTDDGAVALTFRPLHVHRDVRNLLVLRSHFLQPLGFFTGTVRFRGQVLSVADLPGVTEDQDMLW